MQSFHVILLITFLISNWSNVITSSDLICDHVRLGSQSATKWTVQCITSSITKNSAYFNPLSVKNFYIDNGTSVLASASELRLSSAFAEVDFLVSPSVTTFSLLAAPGYQPKKLVNILSTAFAELSALRALYLEGIPLSHGNLHLVLPSSIQTISIVNCGLSNFSIEFADNSALANSSISSIDIRQNKIYEIPAFIYELPSTVSLIDLRENVMNLSTESITNKKQLNSWLDVEILKIDADTRKTLDFPAQEVRSSIVGTATDMDKSKDLYNHSVSASSRGSETVSTMEKDSSLDTIPVAIVVFSIATILVVGIMLAFVARKRRRMQIHETDEILALPHPFDKSILPTRSGSSSHFTTTIESELSGSQILSGEGKQEVEDRDTCFIVPMSPTNSELSYTTTANLINAGYVDLKTPHESDQHSHHDTSKYERKDSNHSLELLSTHSTASMTASDQRSAARNTLRSALTTLLSVNIDQGAPMLTVNTFQYSFDPQTSIEETAFAFFVECKLVNQSSEHALSGGFQVKQLVLKFFVEEDVDYAGREKYALRCMSKNESGRCHVSQLFDDALDYDLQVGHFHDAITLKCSILVLEKPLQAHFALSRQTPEHQVSLFVNAIRAVHSQSLVHGALDTNSFTANASDENLKFSGLEQASRVDHNLSRYDMDILSSSQAECLPPEVAAYLLEDTHHFRAAMSLDIWSLGVIIIKIYAAGRRLEEFKDCKTSYDVFECLRDVQTTDKAANGCFFERSLAQFVPNSDMKSLVRQCVHLNAASRPSIDFIAKHKVFQPKEREVSRATTVTNAATIRMLTAIFEEKHLLSLLKSTKLLQAIEPERERSGKELMSVKNQIVARDDVTPEPLPPSLWLFLPPVDLGIDLTQRANCYSVEQWVLKLKRLQQQRAEEVHFPLVFMCETCEIGSTIPCSITTNTQYGVSVTSSLLSLVMPLVRETMLFMEARAILSNGLSVGEASGLTGPQQWEELRTFYCALERMELATINPVNEIEFALMEQQLKSQDQAKARKVLDKLTILNFSEDKREYVRSLLDALVSDESNLACIERSSWAALQRCNVRGKNSSSFSHTRWLCSHHALLQNKE
ncbi:putative protein kinase domain, leucine-rich repeat domain superfamily [Plasmopara halstedii]